jgi:hypothetical protein
VDREWLMVFDNADGDPEVVAEYFPEGDGGNILLTSRNRGFVPHYVSLEACAEVEDMKDEDAVLLLLKSACITESSEEMKEVAWRIVKELGFLPLAVDQAGAAIKSGLCNIDDYLQT